MSANQQSANQTTRPRTVVRLVAGELLTAGRDDGQPGLGALVEPLVVLEPVRASGIPEARPRTNIKGIFPLK